MGRGYVINADFFETNGQELADSRLAHCSLKRRLEQMVWKSLIVLKFILLVQSPAGNYQHEQENHENFWFYRV